jgi:hypothetical protein
MMTPTTAAMSANLPALSDRTDKDDLGGGLDDFRTDAVTVRDRNKGVGCHLEASKLLFSFRLRKRKRLVNMAESSQHGSDSNPLRPEFVHFRENFGSVLVYTARDGVRLL